MRKENKAGFASGRNVQISSLGPPRQSLYVQCYPQYSWAQTWAQTGILDTLMAELRLESSLLLAFGSQGLQSAQALEIITYNSDACSEFHGTFVPFEVYQ